MSVNKKKIFYETIKIEILAGQYLIDNMQIKLTKALAKNLLAEFDNYNFGVQHKCPASKLQKINLLISLL